MSIPDGSQAHRLAAPRFEPATFGWGQKITKPGSVTLTGFLVAGTGFEPATFGL